MKNYTFYLKYFRFFVLGSFVLLFTFQTKAQAPDNINGVAIAVSVTKGVGPYFAETGKWMGLPSATSDEFVLVPTTTNIAPTFGTYTYSKTSAKIGIISVYNKVEDYHATVMMIFSSQHTGTMKLVLDDAPDIFQEGTFLGGCGSPSSTPPSLSQAVSALPRFLFEAS